MFLGSTLSATAQYAVSDEGPSHARTDSSIDIEAFSLRFESGGEATNLQGAKVWVEYQLVKDTNYYDASPTP